MRILFLTQVLPYPLVGGAKIRAYYVLRQLAVEHDVTLVSFVRADDRAEDVAHLAEICTAVHTIPITRSMVKNGRAVLRAMLRGEPIVIARDHVPEMAALLKQLAAAAPFDAVHADQTAMAQYALLVRAAQSPRPLTVLDQHNALYRVVERQARCETGPLKQTLWLGEARRLQRYEAHLLRTFDQVLTVSDVDRDALLDVLPVDDRTAVADHLHVLPICVDPAAQPPVAPAVAAPEILHLGTMFWPPNVEGVVWFAREVLPRIRERVPDVRFTIAGKQPPPLVEALAREPGVVVTGFVPDPRPLLERCAVFVVPLRAGGGMRVKILDAWQWGLPIVSTTIGAEGIHLRAGENILLADTPAEFADAVTAVLNDAALALRLRENGRGWVETHYNWRTTYPKIAALYAEQLADRLPAARPESQRRR